MSKEVNYVKSVEYTGKFKVGDRVRVIGVVMEDESEYYDRVGVVETVTADDYPYTVRFGDSGDFEWFNEACLTLIDGESSSAVSRANDIPMKAEEVKFVKPIVYSGKFEEGDRVRVTGIVWEDEQDYFGRVGTVERVEEDRYSYLVVFGELHSSDWLSESCLSLVYDESSKDVSSANGIPLKAEEVKYVELAEYTGKFKEGDLVCVENIAFAGESVHYMNVGRVEKVYAGKFPYMVRFSPFRRHDSEWLNEACLTHVILDNKTANETSHSVSEPYLTHELLFSDSETTLIKEALELHGETVKEKIELYNELLLNVTNEECYDEIDDEVFSLESTFNTHNSILGKLSRMAERRNTLK